MNIPIWEMRKVEAGGELEEILEPLDNVLTVALSCVYVIQSETSMSHSFMNSHFNRRCTIIK